jgi:hypothetical protein
MVTLAAGLRLVVANSWLDGVIADGALAAADWLTGGLAEGGGIGGWYSSLVGLG